MKKLFAAGALAATVLGLAGQVPALAKAFPQIPYGVGAP